MAASSIVSSIYVAIIKAEFKGVLGLIRQLCTASKRISPSIITIPKMVATTKMEDLIPLLNEKQKHDHRTMDWHYTSYRLNEKHEIVTAYDRSVFEAENDAINSDIGHYQALRLRMRSNNLKLLYFSVHLPHKNNNAQAYRLLVKAISELSKGFDVVIIGGDWYMNPEEIKDKFRRFDPKIALEEADEATTPPGNKFVNFAIFQRVRSLTWQVSFSYKKIMSDQQYNEQSKKGYTKPALIWAKVDFKPIFVFSAKSVTDASSSEATAKCHSHSHDSQVGREPFDMPDSTGATALRVSAQGGHSITHTRLDLSLKAKKRLIVPPYGSRLVKKLRKESLEYSSLPLSSSDGRQHKTRQVRTRTQDEDEEKIKRRKRPKESVSSAQFLTDSGRKGKVDPPVQTRSRHAGAHPDGQLQKKRAKESSPTLPTKKTRVDEARSRDAQKQKQPQGNPKFFRTTVATDLAYALCRIRKLPIALTTHQSVRNIFASELMPEPLQDKGSDDFKTRQWQELEKQVLKILKRSPENLDRAIEAIKRYGNFDSDGPNQGKYCEELTKLANSIADGNWPLEESDLKTLLQNSAEIVRNLLENLQMDESQKRDHCPVAEAWFCFMMAVWSWLRTLVSEPVDEAEKFRACCQVTK